MANSVVASLDTFFQALQAGGTVKEALDAALQSLTQTLGQGIAQAIQAAMPGPGGAILGTIVGGLVGWGLSKLFGTGKKASEHERIRVSAFVENFPDALKHWTLPSSAYYHPNDFSRAGAVVQNNNNIFNMPDGPGMTSRVQRGISESVFLSELRRGVG